LRMRQVVQRRKRRRRSWVRSQEVLKAREKGELPEKEKKVLAKSTIMKKTRVGMKGKKGDLFLGNRRSLLIGL